MAESLEHPTSEDSGTRGAPRVRPPMPRWVKVFLAIVLVIVAAVVISQLLGIRHGPGMHGALGATEVSVAVSPATSVAIPPAALVS